jgi:hypothetical protein
MRPLIGRNLCLDQAIQIRKFIKAKVFQSEILTRKVVIL